MRVVFIADKKIIDQVDYYINPDTMELIEYGKSVIKEQDGKTKSEFEDVLTRRLIK